MENRLRHKGVSGSLLGALTRSFMRFLVAAELFPEARYDPVPVLEKVHQPVLALWGAMDRTAVPAESAEIMQAALERGGNPHYTITFFPKADHDLHQTPDGFLQGEAFALGYIEKVIAWIYRVALGEMLDSSVAEAPPQERASPVSVINLPWYESGGWLQLGVFILLKIGEKLSAVFFQFGKFFVKLDAVNFTFNHQIRRSVITINQNIESSTRAVS